MRAESGLMLPGPSVLIIHPIREKQDGLGGMFLDHADRNAELLGDLRKAITLHPIEQEDLAAARAQRIQSGPPMLKTFAAGINRIGQRIGIDERKLLQGHRFDGLGALAPPQIMRKIERRAYQESLCLAHLMIAAIKLKAQKCFLDQVVGVIGTAAAAAQQPAQLG